MKPKKPYQKAIPAHAGAHFSPWVQICPSVLAMIKGAKLDSKIGLCFAHRECSIAALLTLKANWFDTLTLKQWEITINSDVLLFSATNQETPVEQLLHYCIFSAKTDLSALQCIFNAVIYFLKAFSVSIF